MRICIIQAVLPLYAISFFNRMVELFPEIDLVVLADLKSSEMLNQHSMAQCSFRVVQLDNISLRGFIFRPKIFRVLKEVGADIIVFSGSTRDLSQLWAMAIYRVLGKHFAAWGMFHRIGSARFISNAYYRLAGFLASKCLTYTRVGGVNLLGLGVPKSKITIVGTAIDEKIPFELTQALTTQDIVEFKKQELIDNKHVILQVVRLSRIKHPELLVLAAIELLKTRRDIVFVLIGDGEMKEELSLMVESYGMRDNFRILGSIYDEKLLSRWFLCADVCVVPTFIGLSAHHAMAYGVPVVTDDSLDSQGSEFDILSNGLNSFLYKEGDPHDMARVLEKIINDPILREQMSINARATVERVHNLDNKARQFVQEVKKLVKPN